MFTVSSAVLFAFLRSVFSSICTWTKGVRAQLLVLIMEGVICFVDDVQKTIFSMRRTVGNYAREMMKALGQHLALPEELLVHIMGGLIFLVNAVQETRFIQTVGSYARDKMTDITGQHVALPAPMTLFLRLLFCYCLNQRHILVRPVGIPNPFYRRKDLLDLFLGLLFLTMLLIRGVGSEHSADEGDPVGLISNRIRPMAVSL